MKFSLAGEDLVTYLLILGAGLIAAYAYFYWQESKNSSSLTGKQIQVLRALRICVGIAALLALARPAVTLVRSDERLPVVAMLVDESISMSFPDSRDSALIQDKPRSERTRYHAAREAVQRLQVPLSKTHEVKVFTFSDSSRLLKSIPHREDEEQPPMSREQVFEKSKAAEGEYSNVGDGVADVLRELSSNKISGIVVMSDFQETGGTPLKEIAERAATVKVPVHSVALGTEYPLRDLAIDDVIVSPETSLGDVLTFHVKVTNQIASSLTPKLTLYEEGKEVASKTLTLKRGQNLVSISTIPGEIGTREFKLSLPVFPDEVNTKNNEQTVHVEVVKRTIRVLLVASEASLEFMYLVPALLRDPVISLSVWLQSADIDYIHQGNKNIERMPESFDDWKLYDVAILMDVDPNGISSQQIGHLETMVNKGGGLLVLAGRIHGMGKLLQVHATKIRQMLPVEFEKGRVPEWEKKWEKKFKVERTPAGRGHPIMLASSNEAFNEELWSTFPDLYWHHPVKGLKGKAVSLLERVGPKEDRGNTLMALMRYNEGSVFYTGLNALWRWRDPYESFDYDRFWTRVIRYLGESRLKDKQQNVALSTDRNSYAPGEGVQLNLRIIDYALWLQLKGQPLFVKVVAPDKVETMVPMKARSDGATAYQGTFRAKKLGSMRAFAKQAAPGGDTSEKPLFDVNTSFQVKLQSLEHVKTMADLEAARFVASETGGRYYDYNNMENLAKLVEAIPTKPQVLTETIQKEVWDGFGFLALFLVLVTAEWCLRKLWGLL